MVLTVIFASQMVGLQWFSGSATSAADDGITLYNFALPVLTIAIYGMGYIARMTRASMAEVMTQQYIRTARLKGVGFRMIVLRHALRNALIAPFTVIMLQFPWLLTGVVIVETLFNYRGFGWLLIEAAANNDINLLLACSIVAVVIVLVDPADLGHRLRLPQPAHPGDRLMQLAFLDPGQIVAADAGPVPAGVDRDGRRSSARARFSAAGSAPTAASSTPASASLGFALRAVLAADRDPRAPTSRSSTPTPSSARCRTSRPAPSTPSPACPTSSAATRSAATSSAAWSTAAAR